MKTFDALLTHIAESGPEGEYVVERHRSSEEPADIVSLYKMVGRYIVQDWIISTSDSPVVVLPECVRELCKECESIPVITRLLG